MTCVRRLREALLVCLTATLAQAQTGLRVERHFELMRGMTTALAWSPAGDRLAIGGILGDVVVVDERGGEQVRLRASAGTYAESVMDFCWARPSEPEDRPSERLVVATRESIELHDVARRVVLAKRVDMVGPVVRVPGSGDFVAIGKDGNPRRLAGATLEPMATIQLPPGGPAIRLALSPDGHKLAVATSRSCQLFVFDFATGERLQTLEHDPGAVTGLAWPPFAKSPWWSAGRDLHAFGVTGRFGGESMVACPTGRRVAVRRTYEWKLVDPEGVVTPLAQTRGPLALHPDGEEWALGRDGCIDFGRGGEVSHSIDAPVALSNLHHGALIGGGNFVALEGERGVLSMFDRTSGRSVATTGIPRPGSLVRNDGGPELIWAAGGQVEWWLPGLDGAVPRRVRRIAFEPLPDSLAGRTRIDGRWLSQGAWHRLDLAGDRKPPWRPRPSLGGRTAAVCGDVAKWVVLGFEGLHFLGADGREECVVPHEDSVFDVAVSPGRSRVAVIGGNLRIIDLRGPGAFLEREPFGADIRGAGWIDEHRLLVTGFIDLRGAAASAGYAAIYSADTGAELERMQLPVATVLDIEPQAKCALVSSSGRATVIRWD